MSTPFNVRQWATQAGIETAGGFEVIAEFVTLSELQRFAEIAISEAARHWHGKQFEKDAAIAAAVAAEREACAKVCDALRDCEENTDGYRAGAGWCGEAIRSRGT